jgi:TonB family protein
MPKQLFVGLILSFLCLPLLGWGQSTKRVSVTDDQRLYQEVYSVISKAPAIRHGDYRRYSLAHTRLLRTQGYYANGRKDSLWTEYHPWSKQVWARGRYHNNQPVGVWEYYTLQGVLEQKYDYSRRQVLFNEPEEWSAKVSYKPLAGGTLDVKPVYIGGYASIMAVIRQHIKYPKLALRNQVEGSVQIAFTIDANGKTSNHRVVKQLGAGCDEEALRVVRLIPDNWIPARVNGQPVASECVLPVLFRIAN